MSIEVPAAWRRTSRDIFDAAKSEMRGARAVRPVVLPRRVKYRPAALHTLATRALRFDEIAVQEKAHQTVLCAVCDHEAHPSPRGGRW